MAFRALHVQFFQQLPLAVLATTNNWFECMNNMGQTVNVGFNDTKTAFVLYNTHNASEPYTVLSRADSLMIHDVFRYMGFKGSQPKL